MKHKYPSDWDKIAEGLKAKHQWKCERCGHFHDPKAGYCLTVHHLDGNPQNCEEENLAVLCQRCHLHIQKLFLPCQVIMDFAIEPWMKGKSLNVYHTTI